MISFLLLFCSCSPTNSTPPSPSPVTSPPIYAEPFSAPPGNYRIYTADGNIIDCESYLLEYSPSGEISVTAQDISYPAYSDPLSILSDPPPFTVMDVCDITLSRLESGNKVLVLLLDGLGYEMYEKALADNAVSTLLNLYLNRASSAYPTISPVNLAAITSGVSPANNGVFDRNAHYLTVPTMFERAADMGLASSIIEGDVQMLELGIPQELNPDLDGDGDTDNEVFASALNAVSNPDYSLVFVHFHGIDDTSHNFGPNSYEVTAKITQVDGLIAQLLEIWDGDVIAIADHGQHEYSSQNDADSEYNGKRGIHGTFAESDIFVPLLTSFELGK